MDGLSPGEVTRNEKNKSFMPHHSFSSSFSPGRNDVIVGKGRTCDNHVGNKRLRLLVEAKLDEYSSATCKNKKTDIIKRIIAEIRKSSPTGSFIKQNRKTKQWHDVGNFTARVKISRLFRKTLDQHYKSSQTNRTQSLQMLQVEGAHNICSANRNPLSEEPDEEYNILKNTALINCNKPTDMVGSDMSDSSVERDCNSPSNVITDLSDFKNDLFRPLNDSRGFTELNYKSIQTNETKQPQTRQADGAHKICGAKKNPLSKEPDEKYNILKNTPLINCEEPAELTRSHIHQTSLDSDYNGPSNVIIDLSGFKNDVFKTLNDSKDFTELSSIVTEDFNNDTLDFLVQS